MFGRVAELEVGAARPVELWVDEHAPLEGISVQIGADLVQVAVQVAFVRQAVLGIEHQQWGVLALPVYQQIWSDADLPLLIEVIVALGHYSQATGLEKPTQFDREEALEQARHIYKEGSEGVIPGTVVK